MRHFYSCLFALCLALGLCVLPVARSGAQTDALQAAIQKNFAELNNIRQNPKNFAGKYKVPALGRIPSMHPLTWDTTLARLAQRKAADMATKNYFAHLDKSRRGMNYYLWKANYPLPPHFSKAPTANGVESIAASTDGPDEFIKQLIIDQGDPNLGHRKHLLGLGDFKTNTHVGIGIAYNPKSAYGYYICILMAPRVGQKL